MRKETIQGLAEAIRQGNWHSDYMFNEAASFLNCATNQLCRTYKDYIGNYFRNIIVTSLEAFLEENHYTKLAQKSIGSNGYQVPKKEDIEIAPDVFKSCYTEHCFFLQKDGIRFILEFQNGYNHESWWATVFYKDSNEDAAKSFLSDLETFAKVHSYLHKAKIDANLSFIPKSNYSWDDIVLPPKVFQELQMNISGLISNIDLYKHNNLQFKRGLILQGPPGTGKSLIGKILCNSVDCTFLWVTPRFLERSAHVKTVCDMARELSPSILFLEDIDLYSGGRESSGNAALLGELMNQLDGLIENHFVIVIATTNCVETVENALRNRPGRFDRVLSIDLPTGAGRLKMLQLHTKNYALDNVNLEEISQKLDKYTGAHVKELVVTAAITAIDEKSLTSDNKIILKMQHFLDNIEKVRNKKITPVLGFQAPAAGFGPDVDLDDE